MFFVLICLAKHESLAPKHALADDGSRRGKGIDDERAKNLNINLKLKRTRSVSNIRFNFQISFGFKRSVAPQLLWTTTPSMQEVSIHEPWNPMSTFPRKPSGYAGARACALSPLGSVPRVGFDLHPPGERWRHQ